MLATIAVASCRDPVAPPLLPPGAEPFTAPLVFAVWWAETEQCAGRRGDLHRVEWFVAPRADYFEYEGELYNAYWWADVHWVLVARAYVDNGPIIRHEMLHDLLNRGDHPPEYFQERCAGIVDCGAVCRGETG